MRDEDDSPYLSQDEEPENEDFGTAVDLEMDCCEVDISNESLVNRDVINVSMIISEIFHKYYLNDIIVQKYDQEDHGKNTFDVGFQYKVEYPSCNAGANLKNKIINIESFDWLQSRSI